MKQNPTKEQTPDAGEILRKFNKKFVERRPFSGQVSMNIMPPAKSRMELEEGCPNFGGGNNEPMIPEERNTLVEPEPDPIKNQLPYIWELVMKDMEDRHQFGIQKYGTGLQPFNGRNPRKDSYQEKLDDLVYTRQQIFEDEYKDAVIQAAIEVVAACRSSEGDINVQKLMNAVDALQIIRGK